VADPIKNDLESGRTKYRRIAVGRDPASGQRRRLPRTYNTRKEANAEYTKLKHQTDEGTFAGPGEIAAPESLDTRSNSAIIVVTKAAASNDENARRRRGGTRLQRVTEEGIEECTTHATPRVLPQGTGDVRRPTFSHAGFPLRQQRL
jgi:hypothetical protein